MDPFADVAERLTRLRLAAVPTRQVRVRRAKRLVAFGRRDERRPGFDQAVRIVDQLGYPSIVRPVGGTFVPLDEGSLLIDEFGFGPAGQWPEERFREHVDVLMTVFTQWGLDPHLGELPGEYCPGRFSVSHDGRFKVSGTAQRAVAGAWLVSTTIRMQAADRIRPVIQACSDALNANLDPRVAGAVDLVAPVAIAGAAHDLMTHFVRSGAEPL